MRIGILQTGEFPDAVVARQGSYPAFFTRLLVRADPGLSTFTVNVEGGAPLGTPQDADGWLVTGSRHGSYEDHAWIPPLEAFLRDSIAVQVPVVGVCFGHQILAQALGGRVDKSDKGWGLGVQDYDVGDLPDWAAPLVDARAGIAIHQDQVVDQPPNSHVLMRSDFCPYAALAYGTPEAPVALSVQPHPEYTGDLLQDMIDVRLQEKVPGPVLAQAVESLNRPVDADPWARTIVEFYRQALARKRLSGAA